MSIVKHGPAGVDLFVVLSGFCLFWPQLHLPSTQWNWKRYAIRRVKRIVPGYYGAIVYAILLPVGLVICMRVIGHSANFQPIPSMGQVLSHLLFLHTFSPQTWDGITGAFWSVGLEMQLYVVFPFIVLLWRKVGGRIIVYVVTASVLFRIGFGLLMTSADPIYHFLFGITFIGRWMEFAAGMAAALAVCALQKNMRQFLEFL